MPLCPVGKPTVLLNLPLWLLFLVLRMGPPEGGAGAPECVQTQEAGERGRGGGAGTFLPGRVVRVEIPRHRDHLEDEVVPSLADHVNHLPMADFDNVLVVHLWEDGGCG